MLRNEVYAMKKDLLNLVETVIYPFFLIFPLSTDLWSPNSSSSEDRLDTLLCMFDTQQND